METMEQKLCCWGQAHLIGHLSSFILLEAPSCAMLRSGVRFPHRRGHRRGWVLAGGFWFAAKCLQCALWCPMMHWWQKIFRGICRSSWLQNQSHGVHSPNRPLTNRIPQEKHSLAVPLKKLFGQDNRSPGKVQGLLEFTKWFQAPWAVSDRSRINPGLNRLMDNFFFAHHDCDMLVCTNQRLSMLVDLLMSPEFKQARAFTQWQKLT